MLSHRMLYRYKGFDRVPQAADLFAVVDNDKELKRISSERRRIRREIEQKKMAFSLDQMSSLIKEATSKLCLDN